MSFSQLILFILLFKILVSCSVDSEDLSAHCSVKKSEKDALIIGENDWILASETGDVYQNQSELSAGLVIIPKIMAKCTGFLINEDTLMTNNHCISAANKSDGVSVYFRLLDGRRQKYDCSEFIMTNSLLDFTLMRCKGSPGREVGWVSLSDERPKPMESIYLVQENCDYIRNPRCEINKYVSYGRITKLQTNRIYHDADTLGGSSGSPIFSRLSHQVIAIHNSGFYGETRELDLNLGIPMFQIRSYIENNSNIKIYDTQTDPVESVEDNESSQGCSLL